MKRKKKNAFTLIELLAVIVILALIALIATPIILGIVEDARKDAFLRSVELVVSATDLDVINKLTDTGHEYKIIDGKIVDEEIAAGYEITENCETAIANLGAPAEDVTTICNDEVYQAFDGLSITEFVSQNSENSFAKELVSSGAVKEIYNYNDLNLVKNTEGMNGIITYDKAGKEVYAIHNGLYCVTKKSNMEKAEVNDYAEGNCSANIEATDLTFQEFLDLDRFKGDKTTSGNGQLIDLGKYGIRYQGNDPDNYVYFNCSDYSNQSSETCEVWRIIGVVDGKVKIISTEFEIKAWNDQDEDGDGIHITDWNNSTLKTYLNGEYLTSLITKNEDTGNMISPSTWYLRASGTPELTKDVLYNLERTTGTILYETPYIENTKIGLMYPSDWGYAAMETETCLSTTSLYDYEPCKESNWIAQGLTEDSGDVDEWLITPYSGSFHNAFLADLSGLLGAHYVVYPHCVRPTLYLSSDIEITGEGTPNSPYKLQAK